jgi:hypothetical protein
LRQPDHAQGECAMRERVHLPADGDAGHLVADRRAYAGQPES